MIADITPLSNIKILFEKPTYHATKYVATIFIYASTIWDVNETLFVIGNQDEIIKGINVFLFNVRNRIDYSDNKPVSDRIGKYINSHSSTVLDARQVNALVENVLSGKRYFRDSLRDIIINQINLTDTARSLIVAQATINELENKPLQHQLSIIDTLSLWASNISLKESGII